MSDKNTPLSSGFRLTGDYHTHTVYSHGKGTVEENVQKAIELGLKQIAITDHGLSHVMFGLTKKKLYRQKEEIEMLREKYPQIDILFGIEANLIGAEGVIDLQPQQFSLFDIVLCGYHKPAWPNDFKSVFEIYFNAYFNKIVKPSAQAKARNTKALANAVKKNKIDVLAHINYHLNVNCDEIAKVCADYGTYIELSSRHTCTDEVDIENLLNSNVQFILNSDAHKVKNIAVIDNARALIEKYKIPESRIANINGKQPVFRSKI